MKTLTRFLLILLVLFVSTLGMAQGAREVPLSNEEVVNLCKLDLGDEVVIAKINQAKSVDFKLEISDLTKLKAEGVTKPVIAAMLTRATAPKAAPGGPAGFIPGSSANTPEEGVFMRRAGKEVRMQSVQGDRSTTWAYVVMLTFLDFPGLHADLRTTERRPTIIIQSSKNPRGRIFLVKCESNKKDNNRSVKIGKAGFGGGSKSWSSPDSDWTAEFDTKEVSSTYWELTPKRDLEPGEYGILYKGGFLGMLSGEQGELFDFGVD